MVKTTTANVHFNENGTPVADTFDDVYFSNDSGIEESRYVFLQANQLPVRWQSHQRPFFVIAETGFGTGLNLLVTMQAFSRFRVENPAHPLKHLYFLSTEKYPLSRDVLHQALAAFGELEDETSALIEQYPPAMDGCHRCHFSHYSVTLDLWMGDIHDTLPQWSCPPEGLVDAWYLDGFAPSKNPDMWTSDLFQQMAELSREKATFATFTAAGLVRRGLTEAGFAVNKVKGFGRKREMLNGHYMETGDYQRHQSALSRYNTPAVTPNDTVVVVGGGIAGSACALALCQRGVKVTLCFRDEKPATGASGNPQGGFYPQLHAQASLASQIQAHSFLFASRYYRGLYQRHSVPHDFCGVLQLGFNESAAQRLKKLSENQVWPKELVTWIDASRSSELAGVPLPYPALSIPEGGWISPPDTVNALIEEAMKTGNLTLRPDSEIARVSEQETQVVLTTEDGKTLAGSHAILACGHGALMLPQYDVVPLRAVRGQVEAVPGNDTLSQLKQVLCHKGYLTPAYNRRHALGSTYVKQDVSEDVRSEESQINLTTHKQALSDCAWMQALSHDGQARAAVRLGVPDHQPLCGPLGNLGQLEAQLRELPNGKKPSSLPATPPSRTLTLTALGSRGLTTAPLLAEILVNEMCSEPLPLPEPLLNALAVQRFLVRDYLKGAITPPSQEE